MADRKSGEHAARKATFHVRRQRQRLALRDQMLDMAAEMILAEGAGIFSMRKLAQALGCAPMSLYTYFRDKNDLLSALAQRSFDDLASRLDKAKGYSPLESLRNVYIAYVRFAFEHPEHYRLIFMTPETHPPRILKDPAAVAAENQAFSLSLHRVQVCVQAGVFKGDIHAITTLLWTAMHGAVAALLNFPAFPFGDKNNYSSRVFDLTVAALRHDTIQPLV